MELTFTVWGEVVKVGLNRYPSEWFTENRDDALFSKLRMDLSREPVRDPNDHFSAYRAIVCRRAF
jgi:hypothetical protein